jgi:signal transduction histidine kinase
MTTTSQPPFDSSAVPLNINLFSSDSELIDVCREMIHRSPHLHYVLNIRPSIDETAPGGICVFDLAGRDPDRVLNATALASHAVLVTGRDSVRSLIGGMPRLHVPVLLKPVTRARLEIALDQALDDSQNGGQTLESVVHANIRLQEHDQDRAHFQARAVHELRAPLTALSGYCDLLLERRFGAINAEQSTVISRMRHSISRLSSIASAILQLSAGQSEASQPLLVHRNYLTCIEQALHEVAPLFEERRIEVDVDLAPCERLVAFDAQQMEEVFINVLDNCCKFTPRGGMVRVCGYPVFWDRRADGLAADSAERLMEFEDLQNAYRVDVSDNGSGISPANIDDIFEEYTTFGQGTDRSGAGLGLAICKMIVSRHQGKIWAQSSMGLTMFSIVLPMTSD